MKRALLIAVSVAFLGCGDDRPKNPPPPKLGNNVEINAPGVSVKTGDKGTDVKAPGIEVKTKKD